MTKIDEVRTALYMTLKRERELRLEFKQQGKVVNALVAQLGVLEQIEADAVKAAAAAQSKKEPEGGTSETASTRPSNVHRIAEATKGDGETA